VYDKGYTSVYWTRDQQASFLADLHPGYYSEIYPKTMVNPYIDEFLLENHPEIPFLSHKCYHFDTIFDLSKRYLKLKEINELAGGDEAIGRGTSNKCRNSELMPEYIMLLHTHPSVIITNKIVNWLSNPTVYSPTLIPLLPYKKVNVVNSIRSPTH
jgi:hypothetical protein